MSFVVNRVFQAGQPRKCWESVVLSPNFGYLRISNSNNPGIFMDRIQWICNNGLSYA